MSTTLGLVGRHRVKLADNTRTTSVGGRAFARSQVPRSCWSADRLVCRRCGGPLTLLAQIDTTYNPAYPRALYVFLCLAEPAQQGDKYCHELNAGWRCFRVTAQVPEDEAVQDQIVTKGESLLGDASLANTSIASVLASLSTTPPTAESATASPPMATASPPMATASPPMATTSLADLLGNLSLTTAVASTPITIETTQTIQMESEDPAAYLVGEAGPMLPCHEIDIVDADDAVEGLLEDMDRRTAAAVKQFEEELQADVSAKHFEPEHEEGETVEDSMAIAFEKKLKLEPRQVIRYRVHGKPCWVATPTVTDENYELILGIARAPPCSSCKGTRLFEAQLLSTVTSVLMDKYPADPNVKKMFWSTAVVYTCSQDCGAAHVEGYEFKEEVVVVQAV